MTTTKPGGPRRVSPKPKEIKTLTAKDVQQLLDGGLDGTLLEDPEFMAGRGWVLDPEIERRLTALREERAEKSKRYQPLQTLILNAMQVLGREPSMARVLQKAGYAPKRPTWRDSDRVVRWHGPGPVYTEAEVLEAFNLLLRQGAIVKGTKDPDQGVCLPDRTKESIANRIAQNPGKPGAVMATESSTLGEKADRVSTRAVCVADRDQRTSWTCGGTKKNGQPCTAKVPTEGQRCHHHPA